MCSSKANETQPIFKADGKIINTTTDFINCYPFTTAIENPLQCSSFIMKKIPERWTILIEKIFEVNKYYYDNSNLNHRENMFRILQILMLLKNKTFIKMKNKFCVEIPRCIAQYVLIGLINFTKNANDDLYFKNTFIINRSSKRYFDLLWVMCMAKLHDLYFKNKLKRLNRRNINLENVLNKIYPGDLLRKERMYTKYIHERIQILDVNIFPSRFIENVLLFIKVKQLKDIKCGGCKKEYFAKYDKDSIKMILEIDDSFCIQNKKWWIFNNESISYFEQIANEYRNKQKKDMVKWYKCSRCYIQKYCCKRCAKLAWNSHHREQCKKITLI